MNKWIFYRTLSGHRRYWSGTSVPVTWFGFVCNVLASMGAQFGDFFFIRGLRLDHRISRDQIAAQAYAYKVFQKRLDKKHELD